MKVLLIGNGAREHAIAEKLDDCELYSIMSKKNPAIAQLSKEYWICDIENADIVAKTIAGHEFDLGFSSPDATLAAGISDVLGGCGILVASPSRAASRIEWDKSYMRTLLQKYGIKGSPKFEVVKSPADALRLMKEYDQVAIKPLGLTGGKGVKVSGEHFTQTDDGLKYAETLITKDGTALIEEKLVGEEFTLQAFCDGTRIGVMPPIQDHKRAFVGDKGSNTGGMGSYSTGPLLPFLEHSDIESGKKILQGVVSALKKEGAPVHGILYGQFMATAHGIKIVEFNARFGDPEAINALSLLNDSLGNILLSMAEGQLHQPSFSNDSTVVKYLVPQGYPDKPIADSPVTIDSAAIEESGAKIYYASVYDKGGKIMTTSSRSFAILSKATTLEEAEDKAEKGCSLIHGALWHREDIGTNSLVEKRIERMKSLRGQK